MLYKKYLYNYIKNNSFAFKRTYETRTVNSIYLDTLDLSFLKQNIEGSNNRTKVRIRFYGDYSNKQSINLEFKRKENLSGWKEIYKIPKINNQSINYKLIYEEAINSGIPLDKALLLKNLRPTLFCTYEREYFESNSSKVRVTLDSKIKFARILNKNNMNTHTFNLLKSEKLILEVKHAINKFDDSLNLIRNLPINVSKHSKYIEGLNLTGMIKSS